MKRDGPRRGREKQITRWNPLPSSVHDVSPFFPPCSSQFISKISFINSPSLFLPIFNPYSQLFHLSFCSPPHPHLIIARTLHHPSPWSPLKFPPILSQISPLLFSRSLKTLILSLSLNNYKPCLAILICFLLLLHLCSSFLVIRTSSSHLLVPFSSVFRFIFCLHVLLTHSYFRREGWRLRWKWDVSNNEREEWRHFVGDTGFDEWMKLKEGIMRKRDGNVSSNNYWCNITLWWICNKIHPLIPRHSPSETPLTTQFNLILFPWRSNNVHDDDVGDVQRELLSELLIIVDKSRGNRRRESILHKKGIERGVELFTRRGWTFYYLFFFTSSLLHLLPVIF